VGRLDKGLVLQRRSLVLEHILNSQFIAHEINRGALCFFSSLYVQQAKGPPGCQAEI